jgi:hypothetical protein
MKILDVVYDGIFQKRSRSTNICIDEGKTSLLNLNAGKGFKNLVKEKNDAYVENSDVVIYYQYWL